MKKNLIYRRAYLPAIHDIFMAGLSFFFSLYLRMGDEIETITHYWVEGVISFTVISAIVFASMKLYKGIWRYTSLQDLIQIMKAVTVSILAFLLLMFLVLRLEGFPRSVFLINWFVLVAMLAGPRLLFRYLSEGSLSLEWKREGLERIPVLLIGMNDQTEHFLRQMEHAADADYRVVGIVADDKTQDGRKIRGVRVYCDLNILDKIISKLKRKDQLPQKLLIADESITNETLIKIVALATAEGLTVARLPRITDLKKTDNARLSKFEMRPMDIEDLLGRHQRAHDLTKVKQLLQGARVIITGAGGTIGSELVRQIIACKPVHITLLESSEHNLYQIDQELSQTNPGISRRAVIADVRDKNRMQAIFAEEKPQIVFHAAALKHVPLAEMNVEETVMTNVFGTKNIADLAMEFNLKAMVLISTDKAVNPSSLMGVTKRVAEKYCQSLGQLPNSSETKFITVRFGNVLGSSGSVIPLFQKQLNAGGPITVTDPNMTRYFMTVREAVELVLQAATLAMEVEEKSMIYVLDMGEPVKIVDLARQMIRLAGLKPDKDIAIQFVGLRPGEKLYEELFYGEEAPDPTSCPGVMLSAPRKVSYVEVDNYLRKLLKAAERQEHKALIQSLRHLVPEYQV
jgi:O-antigen biosynthesis protein WbqV